MEQSLIERAARTLCLRRRHDPDRLEPGDLPVIDGYVRGEPCHFMWREFVDDARAVLAVMKEPPTAVLEGALKAGYEAKGSAARKPLDPGVSIRVLAMWNGGVDAALAA